MCSVSTVQSNQIISIRILYEPKTKVSSEREQTLHICFAQTSCQNNNLPELLEVIKWHLS